MFEIDVDAPGRLWIMPCPQGVRLAESIKAYHAAGADVIVSMLTEDEAQALGVAGEAALCVRHGMQFVHHPIADFGLPEMDAFALWAAQIAGWLGEGKGVAVHCRAGIGRSGMMTAGVLIKMGVLVGDAMAGISSVRGVHIPETVEQGDFLADFGRGLFAD